MGIVFFPAVLVAMFIGLLANLVARVKTLKRGPGV